MSLVAPRDADVVGRVRSRVRDEADGISDTHAFVHRAVLEVGAKVSGCTVHFADETYDTGPIILQRTVPVLDDDTPETLAARVFRAECHALPEAIALYAAGRLTLEGRRVRVR